MRNLLAVAILVSATIVVAHDNGGKEHFHLWKDGAPGFEERAKLPEIEKDYYAKQINHPSLTIYRPEEGKANGSAVIILPGGGHRLLVMTSEGRDAGQFMAARGVTAFVLKYRLFREEGSSYQMRHARMDTERAIRTVRAQAKEFGLAADRIGIMAFSAGGELARMALLSPPVSKSKTGDRIDAVESRPDFGILVYPGPLKIKGEAVAKSSPPLFMVATNDDACCSAPVINIASAYNKAGASAELHLYAEGGHAFNMGQRTKLKGLAKWPKRLEEWMAQRGLIADKNADR